MLVGVHLSRKKPQHETLGKAGDGVRREGEGVVRGVKPYVRSRHACTNTNDRIERRE